MIATVIEGMLNRAIEASSAAAASARELEGRRFTVEVEGLALELTISIVSGRARVQSGASGEADVSVKAPPLELLALLGPQSLGRLRNGTVVLDGDLHTAEAFATLLRRASPDLEAELAGWVGDIAAHALGTRLRGLARWSQRSARALESDIAEFLHEESAVLPRPGEVREFCAEVDRLRDDVERAAARLERLARGGGR